MPINEMIPLQGRVADPLNALASGYQLGNAVRQQPMQDKMNQQKLEAGQLGLDTAKQKGMSDREMARLKSVYTGAIQIKPYIDANDAEGTMQALQQRKAMLLKVGYDDTTETDEAIQKLAAGGIEALKPDVDNVIMVGDKLFGTKSGFEGRKLDQQDRNLDLQEQRIKQAKELFNKQIELNKTQSSATASGLGLGAPPPAPNAPGALPAPNLNESIDYSSIPAAQLPAVADRQKQMRETTQSKAGVSQSLQASVGSFSRTLNDPGIDKATGLTGYIQGAVGMKTGSDAGVLAARIERQSKGLVLQAADAMKGTLTDRDITFLEGTKPSRSDDIAIWKDWYANDFIPLVKQRAAENGIDFNSLGLPEAIGEGGLQGVQDSSGSAKTRIKIDASGNIVQ